MEPFNDTENLLDYTELEWDENLKTAFGKFRPLRLDDKNIPDEALNILESYLKNCFISLRNFISRHINAKSLHFVTPIIVCVCGLLKEKVELNVGKDVIGKEINSNGHLQYVIKCGNVHIYLVVTTKEDIDNGTGTA